MKLNSIISSTLALALIVPGTALAQAQATPDSLRVSLEDAIGRAVGQSQEVRLARSQVRLAEAQVSTARSGIFPQLDGRIGYTRTFASPFSGGGGFTLPDSLRFEPDPTAPLADRVTYLEDHAETAGLGGLGSLFGDLPFGQENAYTAAITGSQTLFSGGRLGAGLRIAREYLSSAQLNLQEETAEIELQVRSAYYRARLAQ